MPHAPQTGHWYEYQVHVLPGSQLKFYWNGELVFDEVDGQYTFSQGPVGMRLDHLDTITALVVEHSEEWVSGRRYLNMEELMTEGEAPGVRREEETAALMRG